MSDKQIADILSAVCQRLSENQEFILGQNRKDLKLAEANGLSSLRLQRLTLMPASLKETLERMRRLAEQSEVVNVCEQSWELPEHMTAALFMPILPHALQTANHWALVWNSEFHPKNSTPAVQLPYSD